MSTPKQGPRAARIAERELRAMLERNAEKSVRDHFRPQLQANVRAAVSGFRRQDGR